MFLHCCLTVIVDWRGSVSKATLRVQVSVAKLFVLIGELGLTVVIPIVMIVLVLSLKMRLFSVIIRLILR